MTVQFQISDNHCAIDGFDTLAKLFRNRVEIWGDKVALREKEMGIWESYTWQRFNEYARNIAGGLLSLGLKPGDVVAVLSEDNKEWVFADMGVHIARGRLCGVYPTYQPQQLKHMLIDADAKFLFVENEEQLDKFLEIRDDLPNLQKIYVFDWKGLEKLNDPMVAPIDQLYMLGEAFQKANLKALDLSIDAGSNDDIVLLIYTSGTTGTPKGALISNRYLLFPMTLPKEYIPISDADEVLTYLPLCHAAERFVSLCFNLAHGMRINLAESPETIFQNIQELSPTVIFGVPRIWEKFYSQIYTLMSEATWFGRKSYDWAIKIGTKRADLQIANKPISAWLKLQYFLADQFVFKNLKQLIGLDRAQFLLSGAAPISEDLLKWYLAMGFVVSEIYGQTETGLLTGTSREKMQPGTVGTALPGVDIRLGDNNEILASGISMFSGYHNNIEATENTHKDNWVHTGDVGAVDEDGVYKIVDRIKDIIITAGGKNITPSQFENKIKVSPYLSDVIVIGDARKYLTCLIMIDQENVENYAQANSIPFTDYRSLCARPEVISLIENILAEANKSFSSVEQIKKFRIIDLLLTAEDDELTPTMKLKRSFVEKKYAGLISQMY